MASKIGSSGLPWPLTARSSQGADECSVAMGDALRPDRFEHRQRLSGAGATFDLLPVEKLGHGLLWFSLSSPFLAA
jgi:hypothetical protein